MSDLISRQAAIDALIKWYGCEPTDIGAFENIIEKLPSAQLDMSEYSDKLWKAAYERGKAEAQQRWIPCSERLPEKKDDYLCSYNGCAVVDICEYDPDRNEWGFFYDGGWKVVSNVTAWMLLPEPYAERREEDEQDD